MLMTPKYAHASGGNIFKVHPGLVSIDTIRLLLPYSPTLTHGRSEILEHRLGGLEVYACIGDADTLLQPGRAFRWHFLVAFVDV